MKINNFYFSPLTFNLVVNTKRNSVTDKTFFRPDINSVRVADNGLSKKQLFHFDDGKYDTKKDLSSLSHFPERVEVQEMVDIMQHNLERQVQKDIEKNELDSLAKLDKDFKEKMISSVTSSNVDSSSVASDS